MKQFLKFLFLNFAICCLVLGTASISIGQGGGGGGGGGGGSRGAAGTIVNSGTNPFGGTYSSILNYPELAPGLWQYSVSQQNPFGLGNYNYNYQFPGPSASGINLAPWANQGSMLYGPSTPINSSTMFTQPTPGYFSNYNMQANLGGAMNNYLMQPFLPYYGMPNMLASAQILGMNSLMYQNPTLGLGMLGGWNPLNMAILNNWMGNPIGQTSPTSPSFQNTLW